MQWTQERDLKLLVCILQLYQPQLDYNKISEALRNFGENISQNSISYRIRKIKREVALDGIRPKGGVSKFRGQKGQFFKQGKGQVDDGEDEDEDVKEKVDVKIEVAGDGQGVEVSGETNAVEMVEEEMGVTIKQEIKEEPEEWGMMLGNDIGK